MQAFDWTGWSEWTTLGSLDLAGVPSTPGAYVIATDRPINRAIGTDDIGILDIGETDGLRKRLRDFVRCCTKRGDEGHMAGWRYAFFRFERHFPYETLRVRWASAPAKKAAYALEGRLLLEYIKRHAELPPLNYKFNWTDLNDMEMFFAALDPVGFERNVGAEAGSRGPAQQT